MRANKEQMYDKYQVLAIRYAEITTQLRTELFGAKSKSVTCKGCKSRLTRLYLKTEQCPLCKGSLLSLSGQERCRIARERTEKAYKAWSEWSDR